MTKKSGGKPRRLSVKKQAVKTGGRGGERPGNGIRKRSPGGKRKRPSPARKRPRKRA
jgi:hypothetical protein